MVAALEIAGERYERLVAIRRVASPDRRSRWLFQCDCGAEKILPVERVRGGMAKSCGCLHKEMTAALRLSHGHARSYNRSPELRSWYHAKGRCFNPTDAKYALYGGRGITMCEEWAADFAVFFRHMGARPAGTTLDRIDPDGNYEPGNCRWATTLQQARTRTDNVFVEHDGRRMVLKDFAVAIDVDYKKLSAAIRRTGLPPKEAAATL